MFQHRQFILVHGQVDCELNFLTTTSGASKDETQNERTKFSRSGAVDRQPPYYQFVVLLFLRGYRQSLLMIIDFRIGR